MNSFFLIQRSRSVFVDIFLNAMGSFEVLLLLLAVRGVSSSNSSVSYPFCANFIFLRNFYSNYAILIFSSEIQSVLEDQRVRRFLDSHKIPYDLENAASFYAQVGYK